MRDIVSPLAGFSSPFGRGADPYAILGYKPPLVLDYENSKFRVSGSTSTAPSVVTATRTGLATQLDASGNLVWNAHNLLTYSEQFSSAGTDWNNNLIVVTDNTAIAPDGTLTAAYLNGSGTGSINQDAGVNSKDYTISFWVKSAGLGNDTFRFFGNGNQFSSDFTATSEWVLYSFSPSAAGSSAFWGLARDSSNNDVDILVWGAHLYRSDLGGMAPVPLTRRVAGSTTYVPTTSAVVYLPREEAYTYVDGVLDGPYYQKESDARTNLVTYSEDFTDASWVKTLISLADGDSSPLGGNFTEVTMLSGGASRMRFSVSSLTANTAYTTSGFFKAGTENFVYFQLEAVGRTDDFVWFDLSTGEVGTTQSGVFSATIENYGNGVYRCSASWDIGTDTSLAVEIGFSTADGSTASASGTVQIDGFQFEQGSTPTSYIPTSGSTVTLPADSATISAGNMPAYTNALSFQMEGLMTGESSTFANWTLDANNGIQITSGASDFTFTQEAAGVVDSVTGGSYTSGVNTPFNIASRHGSTFVNGAVDGTALTADTTPTALADLSATTFNLAPTFNGFIKEFRVWADDIGDSGIAEAST